MTKKELKKRITELENSNKRNWEHIDFYRNINLKLQNRYFSTELQDEYMRFMQSAANNLDDYESLVCCGYIFAKLCRALGFHKVVEIYETRFRDINDIKDEPLKTDEEIEKIIANSGITREQLVKRLMGVGTVVASVVIPREVVEDICDETKKKML